MRAAIMYGAGDVRVENVPDAAIKEPTDAVVRVVLSCVCGSDLWPYASKTPSEHGRRMGHPGEAACPRGLPAAAFPADAL